MLAAVDRLIPLAIDMGVNTANSSGNQIALIPFHKGADGFMSNADFKKFYWPSFKATLEGLTNEDVIPFMFVEGGYNQRMDSYVKSLMETCAPGGGYFISPGAVLDQAQNQNMHAYLKSAKQYGV